MTTSQKIEILVNLYKAQYLVSGKFVLNSKLKNNSPRFREFIENLSRENSLFFTWFFGQEYIGIANLSEEQKDVFEDFLDKAEEQDVYCLTFENETSGDVASDCVNVSFAECKDAYIHANRRYHADYSEYRGGTVEVSSVLFEATVCIKKF